MSHSSFKSASRWHHASHRHASCTMHGRPTHGQRQRETKTKTQTIGGGGPQRPTGQLSTEFRIEINAGTKLLRGLWPLGVLEKFWSRAGEHLQRISAAGLPKLPQRPRGCPLGCTSAVLGPWQFLGFWGTFFAARVPRTPGVPLTPALPTAAHYYPSTTTH
jgi:hypothetical protein